MPSEQTKTRRNVVMAAIEAAGISGLQLHNVSGMTPKDVGHVGQQLMDAGRAWKGKRSHKSVRYFAKPEWAQAFTDSGRTAASEAPVRIARRQKADWDASAPAHYPKNPDGSPAYKHTVIERRQPPGDAPIRTTYYQPG